MGPEWFDELGRLLTLEREEARSRLAADRRGLPLAELVARGLVLLDVEIIERDVGLGGRFLITLAMDGRGPLPARLSVGDVVTVAPRRAPVEDPPAGTVVRSSRTELVVAVERALPPWADEGRLRLDLAVSDVTYERARAALSAFAALTSGPGRELQRLVLGERPARFESRVTWTPSRPLNPAQHAAVELGLTARDVAFIHGPPGTGKSTVLAELATQLVGRGQRLLCTAASNAAVDHLLELCVGAGLRAVRVGHPARVLPHLTGHTLDLMVEEHPDRRLARELFEDAFELMGYARRQRTQGRSRQRFANARDARSDARSMMDEARALERKAVASTLGGADVVCATLAGLDAGALAGQRFDVALFDEATQAIEPLSLKPFLKAERVILAGDPHQLPPTVLSRDAAQGGLARSLFERLLAALGDEARVLLTVQHRMHQQIMEYPSARMYDGALTAHPSCRDARLEPLLTAPVDASPVLFLDTAGKGFDEARGEAGSASESLRNEGEAALVVARARELLAAGLAPTAIGVITPYRAQAQLIEEALADVPGLEIDTVDAFQGREKEAILVSCVRSNADGGIGFLADERRLNVAITRARRHLFVVGDGGTLSRSRFLAGLIEHAQATGGYRSAWEWPDPAAQF